MSLLPDSMGLRTPYSKGKIVYRGTSVVEALETVELHTD
jgi:hypothetical protein